MSTETIVTAKLFWTASLPEHWLAWTNDGEWVLFPAVEGGWAKRTAYHGHRVGLRPCDPASEPLAIRLTGAATWDPMTYLDQTQIVEVEVVWPQRPDQPSEAPTTGEQRL